MIISYSITWPYFLLDWVIRKLKSDRETLIEWTKIENSKPLKIYFKHITSIDEITDLDTHPEIQGICGIEFFNYMRTEPELKGLDGMIFLNFQTIEGSMFLTSLNKKNKGVSLWVLNDNKLTLKKILDLPIGYWGIEYKKKLNTLKLWRDEKNTTKVIEVKITYNTR